MGVTVRDDPKGSGVFFVFINHHGKRKAKRIGRDKRLALEIAKKIEAKLALDDFDMDDEEKPVSPTLKEYAETWLSMSHDRKESTIDSYRANLRLHILPALGKRRLHEITRKELKAFFAALLKKGLSPATVGLIKAPMFGILTEAVEAEHIPANPLNDIRLKLKKKRSIEITPLTEEEAEKLLQEARSFTGGSYYPVFLCALRTGLRVGELQALKWADIDFEKKLINVRRSWRRDRITEPKNGKGRTVDMTSHLAETLKALRTEQKKTALKKGVSVSEYVFSGTRDELLNRNSLKNALEKCLGRAKVKRIRIHDLRHSYATMRLMRGHNVGDVSYQLGHSSIKITFDVYGHWIPGKFRSEVEELDRKTTTLQNAETACAGLAE